MAGYQDPKQMQGYPTQQNMMGQNYGPIPQVQQHQQQTSQQRISQHYPQSTHGMYPATQQAPTPQPYGSYGQTIQHQTSRATHNVGYGHAQLDQTNYGHLTNQAPTHPTHHPQQPSAVIPPHPTQQTQPHLSQASQGHLTIPQAQNPQQMHQISHPSLQTMSNQTHSGLSNLNSAVPPVQQTQQQQQQQSHLTHGGMLQSNQHQPSILAQQTNQQNSHQPHNQHQMTHNHSMLPSYGQQMSASNPQQPPSYMPSGKPSASQHGSSPQYRAPFPQLSPQMSPRPPQMSPHPQMSPRPVMSPAKPLTQNVQNVIQPSISPHHGMPSISSPNARPQPNMPSMPTSVKSPAGASGPVNTLQALEQMVMPSGAVPQMDYNQGSYRQSLPSMPNNPLSPLGSRMSPLQHQQWPSQHRNQMNGNSLHNLQQHHPQQIQMQQTQQTLVSPPSTQSMLQHQQQLSDASMSIPQPLQIIPPSAATMQQYASYEEAQKQNSLESIHKPYEDILQSSNQLMQNQVEQYSVSSVQQILNDQNDASDLNLLDSYTNSSTSANIQSVSNEDVLLAQNDNSQSSQISDRVRNLGIFSNKSTNYNISINFLDFHAKYGREQQFLRYWKRNGRCCCSTKLEQFNE